MAAEGGYLNLAYMAELAVVVNLAYLELKSLRYVQKAKEKVSEVLQKLNDTKINGNPLGVLDQFMELYKQAKDLFNDQDSEERRNAWYVIVSSGSDKIKVRYTTCAVRIYEIFKHDRDKVAATILLFLSVLTIVIITILSKSAISADSHQFFSIQLWWWLFLVLLLAILLPTILVLIGRHLGKIAGQISEDIENRKDKLALEIVYTNLNATTLRQAATP
jgi:ABC-type multidrug transport system fused ATPase/permease subunit